MSSSTTAARGVDAWPPEMEKAQPKKKSHAVVAWSLDPGRHEAVPLARVQFKLLLVGLGSGLDAPHSRGPVDQLLDAKAF